MAGNAAMTIFVGGDNSDFLRKWESTKRTLRKGLGSEAMAASEGIATGFAAMGAAMGALAVASVKMAGDMNVQKKSFQVLLKDVDKANKLWSDLVQFAAQTPFELPGLAKASKQLLAYKFAAEDILPIMQVVGDAGSLLGGQEAVDSMIRALGQMQAKGKVSAEEMRQIAETGVGAWEYLAESMGVSVAEAMDKVENDFVAAGPAINALLKGMQRDFKGGMEALSQEIPGLWSTIKDNARIAAAEVGDKIIEAFNIKDRMKSIGDSLKIFADYVKSSGLNAALRDLIPKELTLAIFAMSGALLAAAIPAMTAFGVAVWTAMIPLMPFIAAGMGIAAVAWVIWQAWGPLVDQFKAVFTAIAADAQSLWARLKTLFYEGVKFVLRAMQPLAKMMGAEYEASIGDWLNSVEQAYSSAGTAAEEASNKAVAAHEEWKKANDAVYKSFKNIKVSLPEGPKAPEFNGLTGSSASAAPDGKGDKKAAKAWEELKKKAEHVSKAIEQEWVQTTKTQLEQLDIWQAEQFKALDETKAANENYQRDITRVEAVYSERRKKIIEDEAKKRNSIWDQARDISRDFAERRGGVGLEGVDKEKFDIEADATQQIDAIQRKYRDLAQSFAEATDTQKEEYRKAWEANGIQFEITRQGMVDFSRQAAAEEFLVEAEKTKKIQDLRFEQSKWEEALDKAHKDGDIARYTELLNEKQALFAQDLTGRQELMDTYYQIWQDAHRSALSYMAEGINGLYGGLTTFFSDIFSNTKSIGEAWSNLGKSIGSMLAKMAAQWVASRLTMAIFGKSMQATEAATAAATGATIASAYAPAAAMVSLATMGANSAPAMAGIAATTGMALGLSKVPGLATGGITTGPTLAEIGEGRRQEAVLPLDRKIFERMGLVDKEDDRESNGGISLVIQGGINDAASIRRLIMEEGSTIVKSVKRQAQNFNVAAEVGF